MGERHVHADVIIAFAEGKKVQYYDGQWNDWDQHTCPPFSSVVNWRIKPDEPVVRWLWANERGLITEHLYSEQAYPKAYPIKLEWSRTEFPSE